MPDEPDPIPLMRDIRDYPIMARLEVENAIEQMRSENLPGVVVTVALLPHPSHNPSAPDYESAASSIGAHIAYIKAMDSANQALCLITVHDKPDLTQQEVDLIVRTWERNRQE